MKRIMTAVFLVLLVPLAACAGIFGGASPHTHASAASGGATLNPAVLTRQKTCPEAFFTQRFGLNFCGSGEPQAYAITANVCTLISSLKNVVWSVVPQGFSGLYFTNAACVGDVGPVSTSTIVAVGPDDDGFFVKHVADTQIIVNGYWD